MNMIWHYGISGGFNVVLLSYNFKPLVHQVVPVNQFKKRKPLVTRKCDVKKCCLVAMRGFGGHEYNIDNYLF